MDTLCDDVVFHISTFLTTKDILRLSRVSKNSDRTWGDNTIWKNIMKREYSLVTFNSKKIYKLTYLINKISRDSDECHILFCPHEYITTCDNCYLRICKKHINIYTFEIWSNYYIGEKDAHNAELCYICFENADDISKVGLLN